VSKLANGTITPAAFIEQQINGDWYGPVIAPTARLYWAYLGRIPDSGGLDYWSNKRRNGATLSTISQNFATSNEFTRKYGALNNRAFVTRIYADVLGRIPDASGVNYWTTKLDSGTTRGQVMVNFSESNEYQRKMTGKINVVLTYHGMLRRAPATAELTAGENKTLTTLIAETLATTAYTNRTK